MILFLSACALLLFAVLCHKLRYYATACCFVILAVVYLVAIDLLELVNLM